MRELAENELEDSPNKGPKKKLTMLADVLERTIESGASAANMGYAVRERYKDMFGGQPLEDVSMLDNTDDALASAQKTVRKKAACRSLFGDGDQKQEPRHLRVRLRRVGDVDVPAPGNGAVYTPMEATTILLGFKRQTHPKKIQIKPIIKEWIANKQIPIGWSAMNDRVNIALKHEDNGGNLHDVVRGWNQDGRPKIASVSQAEAFASENVGHDRALDLNDVTAFVNASKKNQRIQRGEVVSTLVPFLSASFISAVALSCLMVCRQGTWFRLRTRGRSDKWYNCWKRHMRSSSRAEQSRKVSSEQKLKCRK